MAQKRTHKKTVSKKKEKGCKKTSLFSCFRPNSLMSIAGFVVVTAATLGMFAFYPNNDTQLNAYFPPPKEPVFATVLVDGEVKGKEGFMFCLDDEIEKYTCSPHEDTRVRELLWMDKGKVVEIEEWTFLPDDSLHECEALLKENRKAPCVFVTEKGFVESFEVASGDPVGFVAGAVDDVGYVDEGR